MRSSPICSMENKRQGSAVILAVLILFAVVALSFMVGAAGLSLAELADGIARMDSAAGRILRYIRLPRTLATVLCGAGLAVAGVVLQTVLHNPLASPSVIGVNSGAGLGAVLCMAFMPAAVPSVLSLSAFLGALAAMGWIYGVSRACGASRYALVLTGVAVSSLFSACIDALTTFFPDCLPASSHFRIGSAAGVTMTGLQPLLIVIPLCILVVMLLHSELDILSLGDETAQSLGLKPARYRFVFLGLACVLAGSAVSVLGLVSFVGLLVPHMVRMCFGGETRRLLPLCALYGASFLTICDVASRTLFVPYEIPVGIIMAFFGAPFFLILLIRRRVHD